jgi:class 3 adenylate cyclase
MDPQIRYTHSANGVAIAYATVGTGRPLLVARSFLSPGLDDEIAWVRRESSSGTDPGGPPIWPELMGSHSIVLWDLAGGGLSGSAPEAGFADWLADIDAVADAVGAERFDLFGNHMPCHLAMAYAARKPNRVDHLVLMNPLPPGSSARSIQPAWLFALAHDHWHDFVDILALRMHTWERADVARRWADRMRAHYTAEGFLHFMDVIESMDATMEVGSIRAPTLVIDSGARRTMPGGLVESRRRFLRELAAMITGAQLTIVGPGPASAAQAVERFLTGEAAPKPTESPGTAIVLFADIVDSTALTERMGDAAFRERARALDEALRAAITGAGGTAIDGKLLGDGVLATFPAASQAIDAALRCAAAGNDGGLPLHLGIHAGDVIREADAHGRGNVYGGAVNIASRISGLSAPGEVLVSRTVADLARTSAGVTFEDRGEHALKGVADPQRVYAVRKDAG